MTTRATPRHNTAIDPAATPRHNTAIDLAATPRHNTAIDLAATPHHNRAIDLAATPLHNTTKNSVLTVWHINLRPVYQYKVRSGSNKFVINSAKHNFVCLTTKHIRNQVSNQGSAVRVS
jgi:hypothetical protein